MMSFVCVDAKNNLIRSCFTQIRHMFWEKHKDVSFTETALKGQFTTIFFYRFANSYWFLALYKIMLTYQTDFIKKGCK